MENRTQNLQTVLAFFAPETRVPGGAKLRAKLFSNTGVKQVCYPIAPNHTGSAPELPAKSLLESQPDVNTQLDLDCVIWATEDPCCFRAETIEQGQLTLCGTTGPFRGYSLHTFVVKAGKIESWRVFPNTFTVYPTLGLEITNARGPAPESSMQIMEMPPEMAKDMAENSRRISQELLPTLALNDVEPVSAGGGKVRLKVYGDFDPADEALREKNRQAVRLYFDKDGRAALNISRNDLFTEDGLTEIPVDHMSPLSIEAHAFTTKPGPSTNPADPHWRTDIIRFDATALPDTFWVETRSYHVDSAPEKPLPGMPTYTSRAYWNNYNFFFQVRDGKIYYCREFLDPRSERRVMGISETPLPEDALDVYRYL